MTNTDNSNFRKDVQGLRGIAVLLVVIYHTGIGLPGGFVGVDMFFVISGFVITQRLMRELEQTGTIRFRNFYARRARRLLPALALVTVVILGFSVLALSPFGEQQQVAKTARATSYFGANIYFFLENTYFQLEGNPFRHMWSLAVEEQFYLVLPFTLLVGWKLTSRFSKQKQRVALVISVTSISIISFVGGALLSFGYRITPLPERFAFFGTPSRIWELGLGVLLALVPLHGKLFKNLTPLLFVAGVGAVAWSVTQIESFTPFPGVVALAPVFGTAFLIIAGRNSRFSEQILSWRPIAALGDISYGWYLWHWPFVVFAQVLWPDQILVKVTAALLSLAPTVIMYRFFESPIRRNERFQGRRVIALTLACILLPVGLSLVVGQVTSRLQDFSSETQAVWSERRAAVVNGCYGKWSYESCIVRSSDSVGSILLLGDSHAASASDGVIAAGVSLSLDVAMSTVPGCPFFERAPGNAEDCRNATLTALALINELNPDVIVIVNANTRWTWAGQQIPAADLSLPDSIEESRKTIVDSQVEIVTLLLAQKRHVIIVLEVPAMKFSKRVSLLRPDTTSEITNLSDQVDRNQILSDLREAFRDIENVSVVETDEIFCPNGKCHPVINGRWRYMEATHLNPDGALLLVDAIRSEIQKQLASAS